MDSLDSSELIEVVEGVGVRISCYIYLNKNLLEYYFTICLASMAVVLTLKRLPQVSNISSRLGPNKSMTRIL